MNNKAILSVRGLSVGFRGAAGTADPVVHDISFDVHAGEVLALVGESGSGKSVTALALTRLLPRPGACILSGQVWMEGVDLLALSDDEVRGYRGKKIAYIFQEPGLALNPVRSIGGQLREVLMRMPHSEQILEELLRRVGFADVRRVLGSYPHELSGGQLQRIMIAMALLFDPVILIADEPTTALDVTVQAQVMQLLSELSAERGFALLLITHNLALVAQYAHRVAVMRRGRIVEKGFVERVLSAPQDSYTKALLRAVPDGDRVYGERREPMVAEDVLLRVRDLSVWYPVRGGLLSRVRRWVKALRHVDLDMARAEILAVVGESGSGKTTLANALTGLLPWRSGSLEFCGERVDPRRPPSWERWRSAIQMVFQDPYSSLNPRHTVEEILTWPLRARGMSRTEAYQRAREALDQVGLDAESMRRFPHAFSGGQRQRIGIARALAMRSSILICDEPTSALDVSVQEQILELLAHLRREMGLSILFVSHDLAVVRALADRVLVMYAGEIAEQGAVSDIFPRPRHPYTKALLDSIPSLRVGNRPKVLPGESFSPAEERRGCAFFSRCPRSKLECATGEIALRDGARCLYPL